MVLDVTNNFKTFYSYVLYNTSYYLQTIEPKNGVT